MNTVDTLRFGAREVAADRALVMAIVNRTRDSFYDRGATFDERAAVAEVCAELVERAERAVAAGVPRAGVLIDPTHDFGKNTWHGLELLRRLDELVATGWPVLMALSNKDFVGETLDAGLADRVDGTLAATAVAAFTGAAVFRAHQVRQTRRGVGMVASNAGTRPPARCVRALA